MKNIDKKPMIDDNNQILQITDIKGRNNISRFNSSKASQGIINIRSISKSNLIFI